MRVKTAPTSELAYIDELLHLSRAAFDHISDEELYRALPVPYSHNARQSQQQKMKDQELPKPPTPSKLVKMSLPGEKLAKISSSPPRRSDSQGDVKMSGTTAARTPTQAHATGYLNSSPPDIQFFGGGQAQLHSSPSLLPAFGSPQLPSHQRTPIGPKFPRSQTQINSSPPSIGNLSGQREPGQLHSSPPEVKIARARAQAQSSAFEPATPPRLSRPNIPQVSATPPGFPRGFNNPYLNPTVPMFTPPGQLIPPQLPQFPQESQGRQGLQALAPPLGFDRSRITLGLPQKEIDRKEVLPPRKRQKHSLPTTKDGSSFQSQQAGRQWAQFPPAAGTAQQSLGSLRTPELQVAAAQALANNLARGVGLRPNPTNEELQNMVENMGGRSQPGNGVNQSHHISLARNLTPEELEQMRPGMNEYRASLARAPVRDMPDAEQGRLMTQAMSLNNKRSYPEDQIARLYNNVHPVPNQGPKSIGLRLSNSQYANGPRSSSRYGPLLHRRSMNVAPQLAKLIERTNEVIRTLTVAQQENRDRVAAINQLASETNSTQLQEEENQKRAQEATDKELWDAFVDVPWEEPSDASLNEPQEILKPLTPRPGCAPPVEIEHKDELDEEIRARKVLVQTLENYDSAFKNSQDAFEMPMDRPPSAISFPELALAKIPRAKTAKRFSEEPPMFGNWWNKEKIDQMDNNDCIFCVFDCDFGISDQRVWLPEEASAGYCHDCHQSCSGFNYLLPSHSSVFSEFNDLFDFLESGTMFGHDEQYDTEELHDHHTSQTKLDSTPPLKQYGDDMNFQAQALSFSNSPERVQALSQLHPRSVFDMALNAGLSRAGESSSTAGRGVSTQNPQQSSASNNDMRAMPPPGFHYNGNQGLSSGDGSTVNKGKGPAPHYPERAFSAIDGVDITKYKAFMFCRASPYRQVDILKAKICDDCRYKKFAIVKDRHLEWKLLVNEPPIVNEKGQYVEVPRSERNCMICTGLAMFGCTDCPLKLCELCQTLLVTQCKGWLNNLIYHHHRTHIRNDAFLLRSDGFGY